MSDLKYGVRMSVVFRHSDYEPSETFRHPTEECHGCLRLVICPGRGFAKSPVVCEDCLRHIVLRGSLPAVKH